MRVQTHFLFLLPNLRAFLLFPFRAGIGQTWNPTIPGLSVIFTYKKKPPVLLRPFVWWSLSGNTSVVRYDEEGKE